MLNSSVESNKSSDRTITMKKLIIIFFVILVVIISCKKYEENPLINLKTKTNRIEGTYFIAKYEVNGIDSTSVLNTTIPSIVIREKVGRNHVKQILGGFCYGSWAFEDHKKEMQINIDDRIEYYVGPFVNRVENRWRITKLTDRELHLNATINNISYIVHLHEH